MRDFNPTPNQTSGRFLLSCLQARAESAPDDNESIARYNLGFDVYIKQRSYAILNKIFFWLSLIFSLLILMWPIIVVLVLQGIKLIDASVAQTMVTGLAAFCIFVYRYYKRRQLASENLLRTIVFSRLSLDELVDCVTGELARIDQGFGFRTSRDGGARDDDTKSETTTAATESTRKPAGSRVGASGRGESGAGH